MTRYERLEASRLARGGRDTTAPVAIEDARASLVARREDTRPKDKPLWTWGGSEVRERHAKATR
jgi:hypothetical protein